MQRYLTDWFFFFQFVIQYKPQTLFCSSAILSGISHFVLNFALLSSSAFTSTKLHFIDFRSWVSPLRLVLQLVQSHQLQLQALFLPVEILLVSKCPSKVGPRLEWSSPGLGSFIKEGPPRSMKRKNSSNVRDTTLSLTVLVSFHCTSNTKKKRKKKPQTRSSTGNVPQVLWSLRY